LTSALDGGEWSASRPVRFTPRERAPGTHWIGGWVGQSSRYPSEYELGTRYLPNFIVSTLHLSARSREDLDHVETLTGCKVYGTGPGSCPVAGFRISDVERSDSTTTICGGLGIMVFPCTRSRVRNRPDQVSSLTSDKDFLNWSLTRPLSTFGTNV